ncbi:unnamed protein product [Polarella glacialis]|uniref:Uncharacterized protein n=1 Tax=Polarella glacialis TaxID=89957 RepID=A0A813JMF8_POLGL|nr:unnamed protein product [Polarella glacialis]
MWIDRYVPPAVRFASRQPRLSSAAGSELDWEAFCKDTSVQLWQSLVARGFAKSTFFLAMEGLEEHALRRKCRAALGRQPTDAEREDFLLLVEGSKPFGLKRRRTLLAALDREDLQEPKVLFVDPSEITQRDLLLSKATATLRKAPSNYPVGSAKASTTPEEARTAAAKAVAKIVMGAGLPSAGIVAGSLQPEQMALKLAAGMRTSTLKGRLSEHRRMARWLLPVFGDSFPLEPVELLDYLLERSSEPCGPSVPSSVLSMVAFFERVGGVPSASRVSGHGLVQALVDDLKLSLRSELPSPTRKAPQYFTCMIVCWELVVVNTGELTYTRLVAWCKLVKVWAAMRTSDTDCCPPSKMVWRGSGLSGQIDMSKTTGTGKRVGAIHFHVSTGAWICQESWLRTGWLLFEPTRGTRKCLLPLPSKGALTLSEKAPSYTQSCAASQKLTSDCKVLVEGGVERRAVAGDQPLFFLGDQKVLVEGGVERG